MMIRFRHIRRPDSERPGQRGQWVRRAPALTLLGLSVSLLGGCFNSAPEKPLQPITHAGQLPCGKPVDLQTNINAPAPRESAETLETQDIWARLLTRYQLTGISHPRIEKELQRLMHSPVSFNALIARSQPFMHHITEQVEKRDMPAEIALLPAVESGFRPYAYSPDGAAGLWQFMPATGRWLGLRQNWWYDGRRDVLASTEAALDYLESLNKRFDGDWLHALAAYNAGGGTVSRALRKARKANASTEFWDLDLPGETDRYVPRLLALAKIIADPGRYGLALPSLENKPYFTEVTTGGQIDLKVAAKLAKIPLEEMLALNPGYNRWTTLPDGPHRLLLPIDNAELFTQALAKLPSDERLRWKHHRIAKGDNLGKIARQHSVSVKAIQQANGLKDHRIRLGKTLMIPLSESVTSTASARNLGATRSRVRYQVRKGDSLYKIARKFQVKIADLRRWNRVGRYLKPGQRLTVYVDPVRRAL